MKARRILFRCDAGAIPEIGTGHLVRDLLLAEKLVARGARIGFCGRLDEAARTRVLAAGHELIEAGPDEPEADLLARAVVRFGPHVLVLDRLDSRAEDVAAVRSTVPVIVTMDDTGTGARLADLVINAMVGSAPEYLGGLDFAIIPPPDPVEAVPDAPVVLSVGGHDAQGLGERVAAALAGIGPVEWLVSRAPAGEVPDGVAVLERPPDFSARLRGASVAVVNGGLTLVEAVANGVPAVAVAQYEHQARTIRRLAERGAVVGIESAADGVEARVADAVRSLVDDAEARAALRRRALEAVDGRGLARVTDLLTVVDRLPWDSDFFGVEIGRVYPQRLTERLLAFALEEVERLGLRCTYYLCDCHHAESVRLAEHAGFSFVDIRLTLEREARGGVQDPDVRDATAADLPVLEEVASRAYEYSRYYFDHQFSRADCERFYAEWLRKSVTGQLAERTFVAPGEDGEPLGYISVSRDTAATASIGLLGVSDRARGQGIARRLIEHAVWWAESVGLSRVEVVTQGRNYGAQRSYMRSGFMTAKNELWYHLWKH